MKAMMSNCQKPVVSIGTEFPAGKVVAINNDHVLIDTAKGVKQFSFSQVERFIHDARSISQA
jgi:ribosomal protein L27